MENEELERSTETAEIDADKIGIGVGVGATLVAIYMGVKAWIANRELKKEREKNAQYQELFRKHQAEIDALKSDIDREAYKNSLWEALKAETEE